MSAMADLLMMPGVQEIITRRLPLERRKELLTWLAQEALNLPPEAVATLRTDWSHPSLTGPALEEAWGRFLERQVLADAVDAGIADWDWRCNSCAHLLGKACLCTCCPSASGQAHQDAEDALEILAGGVS